MLAILAAAAAITAAPQESPKAAVLSAPPSRACGFWRLEPTDGKIRARAQQLGKLPPANMEFTVLRTDENGCSKPVVVRENVNGDGRFAKNQ